MAPTDISLDEQFVGGFPMFTLSKSHTKEEQDIRRFRKINHAGKSDICVRNLGGKEWNILNVFFFILFQKYVTECGILEAKTHFIFNDFSFNSQTSSWLIFTLQKKNTHRWSRCPNQQKNVMVVWNGGWYFNHMTYSTFTNVKKVQPSIL